MTEKIALDNEGRYFCTLCGRTFGTRAQATGHLSLCPVNRPVRRVDVPPVPALPAVDGVSPTAADNASVSPMIAASKSRLDAFDARIKRIEDALFNERRHLAAVTPSVPWGLILVAGLVIWCLMSDSTSASESSTLGASRNVKAHSTVGHLADRAVSRVADKLVDRALAKL